MLSRLWYFAVAAVAAFAIAAVLGAQTTVNNTYKTNVDGQLIRDRVEIELWLRLDARQRIDSIASMAGNQDVHELLRSANTRRDPAIDPTMRKKLSSRLSSLNSQLEEGAAQLLIAVDRTGVIISQLGGETPPTGASLGSFPVVERALAGYSGDDVWMYNDKLYRIAVRPVVGNRQYLGAIVHAMLVDQSLVQRLAMRIPGASFAFFQRERILAAHVPADAADAPGSPDFEASLPAILKDKKVLEGGRSEPMAAGSESKRATFSLITGSAAHSGVGYGIGRATRVAASPMSLIGDNPLSVSQWALVLGLPLLLGLIGLLLIWIERDRPSKQLALATTSLAKGESKRLTSTDFRGKMRRITENINEALAAAEATVSAPKREAQNLDKILDAAETSASPYFGFASEAPGPGNQSLNTEESVAAAPVPGPSMDPAKTAAPGPLTPPTPPSPPLPGRNAPPAPPVPPKVPGPMALEEEHPFADDDDDEEVATMVAQIPNELLAASADQAGPEHAHFRQVFEDFVRTKRECGEPTAGVTFERFSQTLRKNRDQILSRHGARSVRFTVYVKAGKAALKATPVKD